MIAARWGEGERTFAGRIVSCFRSVADGTTNGFGDARITAATAEMFLHAGGNVGIGRVGLFFQQADDSHDHARGAIAALERAFGKESFLDRMKFVAFGEALDRDDRFFVSVGNCGEAGRNAFAVEQDSAGTALAFAATIFCAGELEIFAKNVEQRAFGICSDGARAAVNSKFESRIHKRFGLVRGVRM